MAEDSVSGTAAAGSSEPPEGGTTSGLGLRVEPREAGRDGPRAPLRDLSREAFRETLRERLREPSRDAAFRDSGQESFRHAAAESTPAAQFAPIGPPPPATSQGPAAPPPPAPTVAVRQPVLLALVIVIALLGAAGAALLGWQLRLLQGQMTRLAATVSQGDHVANAIGRLGDAATQANEIANQALVTSTRPWIGVDTVQSSPIVAGQPLNIEVRVRNSGRTPSTDMQGLFLVYISPVNSPPAALTDACASCMRSVVLPDGVVTYKLSVRDNVMTPDEVQRIKAGKDTMWIVGRLDYRDGEGELHTTKSCLFYRAGGAAGFTACNDGNSAG